MADATAALIRHARPYAVLAISWLLATNQVLSRNEGPDSLGPPPTGSVAPSFEPAVILTQPVYTLFYTFVLTALFAMSWMEHEELFGAANPDVVSRGERFATESMDRCAFLSDDEHLYHFLLQNALVFAFGMVAAFAFAAYLKRVRPPKDHKELRQKVFYFCCFQLGVATSVLLSYSASVSPSE